MNSILQNAIKTLSDTTPEMRAQKIAEVGIEALRDAWYSSNDAAELAIVAMLLLPQDVVTRGLGTCIRVTMSKHVGQDPSVSKMLEAVESLVSADCSMEDAERVFGGIGEAPELDSPGWRAHAALVNLYKYLFDDVEQGVEGIVFFCAEGVQFLSRDYRTWDSAMGRVADIFRNAVPNPFTSEEET